MNGLTTTTKLKQDQAGQHPTNDGGKEELIKSHQLTRCWKLTAVEGMEVVFLRDVATGRLPIALVTFLLLRYDIMGEGHGSWQAGMVMKHYLRAHILIHQEEAELSGGGMSI